MDRDIQGSREEELIFFSSSEPDSEWIPPTQGETLNLAIYSLKNAFKKVVGMPTRK